MRHRSLADCVLLLVDDEEANLDLLEEFLAPDAYAALIRVSDARAAVAAFDEHEPDIVLLDLHMPHRSGFDVLHDVQQRTLPGDSVPVLVLTADASAATRARALGAGAHDFLTKPLDALEVRLRVRNLLNTRLLYREQRRATYVREQVLSVVAHDLRNPLASIVMDAEMLRHLLPEETQPAEHRAVRRIERTAGRMHALIDDLLEVTRLHHGTLAIAAERIAPHALLADAAAMLEPLARTRGVALEFAGPADLPDVHVDGERLVQVLSNLVGNGLKFTPPGGAVRVTWLQREAELIVSVADNGAGIPDDQLPHVFRPFWQGTRPGRRSGLGLGLVITRAIVEAHGGRIWIESTAGAGTTVHFTLPFAEIVGRDALQATAVLQQPRSGT
jgi:signal transduction histidine kinase